MKMRGLQTILASGLLAGLAAGCATGPTSPGTGSGAAPVGSPKYLEQELTGSYLKQRYTQSGLITDSAGHVVVIDEETIKRSGAHDVRDLLIRKGLNR
jgi:hypothetical protein